MLTPHNVATGDREDYAAAPDTIVIMSVNISQRK